VESSWKEIDVTRWARRRTFEGFRKSEFPHLVVGANMPLGPSVELWRERGISPFVACVYVMCRAANDVPAFRQRLRGERVIEYSLVHADFTVPAQDDSFRIRQCEFSMDFGRFTGNAAAEAESAGTAPGELQSDHWVFLSCLPWIAFTHVVQPLRSLRNDCIPRVAWGKFERTNGSWQMPVSVQAHHALVDGVHVARFLESVAARFADPEATFR
jgi:chloramphenicol O-acetyltransferase type A